MRNEVAFGSAAVFAVAISLVGSSDKRLKEIEGYAKWHQATGGAQDMSAFLATSCIGPASWDRSPNPHVPKVYRVFVNERGRRAMMKKGSATFPTGTVVVKEKFTKGADLNSAKPELLTVMIKREPGFETAHGNWEYFTVAADGKTVGSEVDKCHSCHDMNRRNDYVFRTYVEGAEQPERTLW